VTVFPEIPVIVTCSFSVGEEYDAPITRESPTAQPDASSTVIELAPAGAMAVKRVQMLSLTRP